ncbi:MAG: hypothetical protein NVS2B3_01860 [Vulcanimicrobiaceae bacterium]
MLYKRLTLFPRPLDRDAFHHAYESAYVAAAERLPQLLRWRCTIPLGDDPARPYHVTGELYFPDRAALESAFESDLGQAFLAQERALSTGGEPQHSIAVEHEGVPGDSAPQHAHERDQATVAAPASTVRSQ